MTRAWPAALLAVLCWLRPAAAADHLSVMLDWLPNPDQAPLFVAEREGMFVQHGLDVQLIAPSDASTPPLMAASGHVDVAISYQPQLYLLVAHDVPVVRFATLVNTPLNAIVAPSGGPVRTLADLKGRTLGFAVPGIEEVVARAMLASAGLRPADVRLANVNFQIVSALLTHRVDATISAYRNKEPAELAAHGMAVTAFFPEEHGVPAYDELIYVTRRDAVHDPRLPRFVAALREATAWLLDHPTQGFDDFARDHPGQNTGIVRAEWMATLCRFAKSPGLLDRARYIRFGRFMQQQGMIGAAPPLDRVAVQTEETP